LPSQRRRGQRFTRVRSHSARKAFSARALCPSSRRGARPHDWSASIDSPRRSVAASGA
jgi:hypothetical protein